MRQLSPSPGTVFALALACVSTAAAAPQETASTKLVGSGVIPGSHFGEAVDIDGATLAVGVPDHYTPADAPGAVTVYLRDAAGWSEVATLSASDGHLGDEFGAAVALDGDTLIVGAPSRDTAAGEFEGGAYVFTRDAGGVWSEQVKLLPSTVGPPDRFGERMALEGDLAVILARPSAETVVFPYVRDAGGAWLPEPPLEPSFAAQDVALADGTLVLAGTQADGTTASTVYARDGGAWAPQNVLAGSDNSVFARVATDGDTVALASLGLLGSDLKLFRREVGGTWIEQAVVPPQTDSQTALGIDMAVRGDLLVASLLNNGTDSFDSVSLLGFSAEEVWQEQTMLVPPGYPIDNGFGFAVAIDGTTLVIGAPEDDEAGMSAGAVFVTDLQPACPWDLDGDATVGTEDFLDLLAQWGGSPEGPPDFDGDGVVGVTDFLALLANWGPCPQ